ncbi:MAG: acyl carrier protein [Bacteroidetes bacterium RIFCSPLOWO2_12_FULL_31_6]|nr:MAG: acyl carrier protein [Bacteroidetes bacterium RIFCSPLOWO2_12_FULL_31_6]
MQAQEIITKVTDIFKYVLDDDTIVLCETTTATDIEEWDSLSHIQLIGAIEKQFKIKFTAPEIRGFKNVGDICNTIHRKLS